MTECLFPSPTRPYELPWEQKTMWGVIFGAMLFIAISGNVIVLWVIVEFHEESNDEELVQQYLDTLYSRFVWSTNKHFLEEGKCSTLSEYISPVKLDIERCIKSGHKSMRSVTNYFLLNLSIADLLMSALNCIFNFIFMLNSDWPFGSIYCTINNFMANVTVSTSVFTLVAISFDRYIAIVYPLKRRTSRRKVRVILLLVWIFSCMLAAPCLLYSTTMTKRYYNGKQRRVCFMMWPDGRYPTSKSDYIYNIIILVLTYGVPMLVMLICYTLMGRVLWGSKSIGENTERQLESMKSKKKVVRMFIVIVSIFAICWFPYHMFFIYAYHNNDVTSTKYVQHMYLGFYWLAMSNAMVNPIIYYWMNRRFRIYFQRAVCCICFNSMKPSSIRNDSPSAILRNKSLALRKHRASALRYDNKVRWNRSTIETQIQNGNCTVNEEVVSVPVRQNSSETENHQNYHHVSRSKFNNLSEVKIYTSAKSHHRRMELIVS